MTINYGEIGSEYWEADISVHSKPITLNAHKFLLSGRTSLDLIIRDIKETAVFETVYMPSYCCHSMIQPFFENGIEIKFYNVDFKDGRYKYEIDFQTKCDVIFIMQYFGYCNETVEQIIKKLRESGKIVIEDATHSWFLDKPYSKKSNYVFASFRKWTGIQGAVVMKSNSAFNITTPTYTNNQYLELSQKAASLKKQYIKNGIGNKENFLNLFGQAEELLEHDYRNYNLPEEYENAIEKLDIETIKQKRQINAKYLINAINDIEDIKTILISKTDIPLFVPIILPEGIRNNLQQYLIKNAVYCPVHWPLSFLHKTQNKTLYENSLSLVCDQRYNTHDMERMIKLIREFFGG